MELNIQLMKKTKKELEDLAKLYGLKGTYKLNKQALCDSLIPFIMEQSIQIIQMFDKEQKNIFEQLLEKECTLREIENNSQYLFLDNVGFLTIPRTIKQGDNIALAKEIKENYVTYINNIHKQEDLANKQLYYQKLSKYKSAMVNLYGAISIENFRVMYEKYEQETLDIFTLESWLQIDIYLHPNIIIKDRYLVHESLWMVDIQDFYHLISVTKEKEYYAPSKGQLLCYHDENYFEPTGYTQTLKQYLESVYEISQDIAIDAIWTLIAIYQTEIIQTPELLTTILDQWIEMGIAIEEVEEVKQMMPLILNVTNHTRMWIHKGFTPAEIQKNKIAFSKEKVGRNEPCPCGSGKKYKKCCGR